MMTPEKIALVRETWGLIVVNSKAAGVLFYNRLFELAPDVIPLFRRDMTLQVEKLIGTVDYVIRSLDDLEEIMEEIRELALKHNGYGVKERHYGHVGLALLWTLEKGLGERWNREVEVAWLECYTLLSSVMIQASRMSV